MNLTASKKKIYLQALIAISITVSLIIFSENSFQAAVNGLHTWWEIVFPALLPFFIMAEILMGLGVVHFIGALLEPLMRPVFKLPGVGAFAFAMGLASGYPIGAKITGNLRREKLCTQVEGERLVAFCNTADPLFMIGAVAVGMFSKPELGLTLAIAHYISCILVGLIMRFYDPPHSNEDTKTTSRTEDNIIKHAFAELYQARKKDGRPFGELLGDAIVESVNTLLLVGGFIILFSVITEVLHLIGITKLLTTILLPILKPLGIDKSLVLPIISGIFEITNGTDLASQAAAPLAQQVIIASGIIAWSGLSVHAQVATMVNGTDIRIKPYIWARILHGVLASIVTFFIFEPLKSISSQGTIPVFGIESYNLGNFSLGITNYFERIEILSLGILALLSSLILISIVIYLVRKITLIVVKV
ncbi:MULTISPECIES: sporulation integral membrane protein YlbJ [unclassified Candidatus Frackibacter]|uniref:sporulation integral membrane protein YlbJ n=1 Tax=unclassified Candidatus Frackibacter TaxID=2648818 RepID=UPI000888DD70|nr:MULTISPECIES: sporulation integral membrane protein YlbJ [unclassified Candidatus Frackibacter]SDC56440.1 sporulation integral membrane protein YlbJ [Candidatus Frackibacter sp. WG11]SEM70761.1 sporulation integral membrane protein YlbJ [Candidatus Frackibacter sp. WG12]SFL83601.1 sporulation integral membrane protein YlbJ [Candidatus Frackibacter sp. WG13]